MRDRCDLTERLFAAYCPRIMQRSEDAGQRDPCRAAGRRLSHGRQPATLPTVRPTIIGAAQRV